MLPTPIHIKANVVAHLSPGNFCFHSQNLKFRRASCCVQDDNFFVGRHRRFSEIVRMEYFSVYALDVVTPIMCGVLEIVGFPFLQNAVALPCCGGRLLQSSTSCSFVSEGCGVGHLCDSLLVASACNRAINSAPAIILTGPCQYHQSWWCRLRRLTTISQRLATVLIGNQKLYRFAVSVEGH